MNPSLRVLMAADTVGGVWTYALELARALARQGVEVFLATMGAPLSNAQVREACGLQVFESAFRLEWMAEPWEDVRRAGQWLRELDRRLRPDIVHLNNYGQAALAWSCPTLVVGHSCVLSWWRAVRGCAAPAEWAHYRVVVAAALAAASAVVCPTRAMLAALEENYPGAAAGAHVIPNGRDAARFHPGAKESFILSAGRIWDEAKNARALERVARRLPWPVFLAGDDSHPDGGQADFRGVRSLGRLAAEELASYYARAPIYALPARYEPFGLSVLEAALSGCALVLGDIPSLRENWNEAAVFVPPEDSESLARTLDGLIADSSRRGELGIRARARALQFTSRRMAQAYFDCYRELVLAHTGARCA